MALTPQLLRALLGSWPAAIRRSDLDEDATVDLAFTLTSAELFDLLVEQAGWTTDEYAARIADLLRWSLLQQAPR